MGVRLEKTGVRELHGAERELQVAACLIDMEPSVSLCVHVNITVNASSLLAISEMDSDNSQGLDNWDHKLRVTTSHPEIPLRQLHTSQVLLLY